MAHTPDIRKICKACGKTIVLYNFVKDKRAKDGHGSWCKFCKSKKNMEWAKSNPDKIAKISKKWRLNNQGKVSELKIAWRKANREKELAKKREWSRANKDKVRLYSSIRRTKKKLGDVAQVTVLDLKKMKLKNCLYCNGPAEQIDHIIPLARGGRHSIGNLTAACKKCNQSKGSKLLMEWKLRDRV